MAERKVAKLNPEDAKALALSSTGNYRVYRQLWNVDVPQDVTTFRQVQEAVNEVEEDAKERYRKYYSKVMVDGNSKELEEIALSGLKVRDFVPTAGIIRIHAPDGSKVDLLVNYPLDQLEEGANLHPIGRGFERKEAEFEGELLYAEDLRKKSLAEIKITEGKSVEEARRVIEQLKTNPLAENVRKKLEEEGIDLNQVNLTDLSEVKEVFEGLKKVYGELDANDRGILQLMGIKGEEDLSVAITAKDVVEVLKSRKKLEGRVYGIQTEFYPLNGIILGETKDKELVMVFSPERVRWAVSGIGIAKQLTDPDYKNLNAVLTVVQNPYTYELLSLLKVKDKLPEKRQQELEERKWKLVERLEGIRDRLARGENREGEIEEVKGLIKAIVGEDLEEFLRRRERIRQIRNRMIWERTGKERIDVKELLAKDVKYSEGEERYFLKWNTDEQRTPLGFYRKLFVATNTDGAIRGDEYVKRIYNNDVRLLLAKQPTIIPTDPSKGRIDKATDLKFELVYKPYAFLVKNTAVKVEKEGEVILYELEKLRLGNFKAAAEVQKEVKSAIEEGKTPRQWLREFFKERGARIFVNDVKAELNEGFAFYAKHYLEPLALVTTTALLELEQALSNAKEGRIEEAEKHVRRYYRILTEGMRHEEGEWIDGLLKLREKISKMKQAVVYETLAREIYAFLHDVLPKEEKFFDLIQNYDEGKAEEVKREAEKLLDGFEKRIPRFVMDFLKAALEYHEFKEKAYEQFWAYRVKALREMGIYKKLSAGVELTKGEREFVSAAHAELLKDVFLKNASPFGLQKLANAIELGIKNAEDPQLREWWEEFKTEVRKEVANRTVMKQLEENVGVGESVGLTNLKRLVAIQNRRAIEVPSEVPEKPEDVVEGIKVLVESAEVRRLDREVPVAKGQTPLVASDEKELQHLVRKVRTALADYGMGKGEVVLKPAYETKLGVVYGLSIKVDGDPEPIEFKPQVNKVPTLESAFENLKRKGLIQKIKEWEKRVAYSLSQTVVEGRKGVKEQERPPVLLPEQKPKLQNKDQDVGKDKDAGRDKGPKLG